MYSYEVKLTPRGKHYCIARIGLDVVAVSRQVHDSAEDAIADVKEQIKRIGIIVVPILR